MNGRLLELGEEYGLVRPTFAVEWAPQVVFEPSAVREIIEDVLVAGGMSVWYGEPGSGKTTLLLDAMMRMPRGKDWLGKRQERASTLLVAAESPASARMRLEAFRKTHGEDVGAFGILPRALNLIDALDVDDLVETIIKEGNKLPLPIGLIAIDTVARVMPGSNENAGEDMSLLIKAGDRIRTETGAHVAFVHHSGKDAARGARGHSSLKGAIDTEIEVTYDKVTKLRTVEVIKQRDIGTEGMRLTARFVPVEIGTSHWGKPITACVVELDVPASPHLQAISQAVQARHIEDVVLAGFVRLRDSGMQPTHSPSSPDYLPRQLAKQSLAGGFDVKELDAAMHSLIGKRRLAIGVVGTYGNRSPRKGLVIPEEATCTN